MLNFIVLQHRLLIEYIPFLSNIIPSLTTFFLFFIFTYIPLAVGIGYFEFSKGEMKRRPMLNPYHQDTIEAQILRNKALLSYFEGDVKNAKEVMEKSSEIWSRWHKKKT
jgi:hypothetical protein